MLKKYFVIIIAFVLLFICACEPHADHSHEDGHSHEVSDSHEHDKDQSNDHDSSHDDHIDDTHYEEGNASDKDGDEHSHEHDDEHESDKHSIRQTDSHVHGNALLALALDGNRLSIEFESPLYNILGFEHAPSSDAEKQLVEKSESVLRSPSNLFSFNSEASCTLSSNNENFSLIENNHSEHEDSEHKHNEHAHDEDKHEEHAEHRELLIEYQYQCADPEQLKTFSTNLFENFPNLSELETVFLGPGTQLQTVLTPNNTEMTVSN